MISIREMKEGTMRLNKGLENVERLVHLPAVSWKNALGSVFGAASRLHHYRDVHTRMMREALCEIDCGREQNGCNDE
jgi:hypothetical protein